MQLGKNIREEFPIYARHEGGRGLCYLDSAATSLKPALVIEAVRRYYEEYSTNVHRAAYALAEQATEEYEQTRRLIAEFIGAQRPEEIVFVRNATEAFNLLAASYGGYFLKEGEGILLTEMEHHSNLVPWQELARRKNVRLHFLAVDVESGELLWEPSAFIKFLRERTVKLVSLTHASNVLGTINPVAEIARLAHEAGAMVVVDGAQSTPHMPVNVQDLGADFFAFSGHKMLGPTGIGVLWGRHELLQKMPPFLTGGHMIEDVWLDRAVYAAPPARFEAGTPHIAGAIGLGAAVQYLSGLGMDSVREHEKTLLIFAMERLATIPGVNILGPQDVELRSGVIAFTIEGVHPHDIGSFLDEQGVMIRAGDHCARPLHKKFKIPASCRVSFSVYNDTDDIDRAVSALQQMIKTFHVPASYRGPIPKFLIPR